MGGPMICTVRSLAVEISVAGLVLGICCGAAVAQSVPPPAVSVSPVASRTVTETGGFVGVTVERGGAAASLVIPQSAVQLDQAGRYVLVVDDAKKVELRRITTGSDQGRDVVVSSGLKEGELVIVEGIQKVHPGQIVTPTPVPQN